MREKIHLEGKLITLEEIEPKFFPYVVEWRNDPTLNQFIDQTFVLTLEKQYDWYENQYLKNDPGRYQGCLIGVDKSTGEPFGMTGWTAFDLEKRRLVRNRLLTSRKAGSPMHIFEMLFLSSEYLYQFVDVMYSQVVEGNSRAQRLGKITGFVINEGETQYPQWSTLRGMRTIERYRTKEQFQVARDKFYQLLEDE